MIRRTVSPIPIKRRPRFTKNGAAYVDTVTRKDEMRVGDSYNGEFYSSEPLALIIDVYQTLPESKRKLVRQPFTLKPDADNIIKAIMDGLNGKAFCDDKQIVLVTCRKHDRTADIQGEYVTYALLPLEELEQEWNCQNQRN